MSIEKALRNFLGGATIISRRDGAHTIGLLLSNGNFEVIDIAPEICIGGYSWPRTSDNLSQVEMAISKFS